MRNTRLILASLTLAFAVACREDSPLGLGEFYGPEFSLTPSDFAYEFFPGTETIVCDGPVVASARSVERIEWTKIVSRTYFGLDLSEPLAVDTADADLLRYYIARGRVSAGQPDTIFFFTSLPFPHEAEWVLHYRVGNRGAEYAAKPIRVRCGPEVDPDAALPTLTFDGLSGADSLYEVGDTITVNYRIADGAPLVSSRLRVSGPFAVTRDFVEEFAAERIYAEKFVVPRGAQLGQPLQVEITYTDALTRQATSTFATHAVVIDTSPPEIIASDLAPGQYAVGSPLRFTATVREDRRTAWLLWEFDGEFSSRDSLFVDNPDAQFQSEITVIVPADWAAKAARLRVWARDAAGNVGAADSSTALSHAFYLASPVDPLFFAAIALPPGHQGEVSDVVYDAARARVYVSHTGAGKVTVLNALTGAQVAQLDVPPIPGAMDLSPSGDSLLVTQSTERALSVIDLNTLALLSPIALTAVDSLAAADAGNPPLPNGLRVAANGKVLVMLHRVSASGHRYVELDLATGVSRVREDAAGLDGGVPVWWRRSASSADRTTILLLDPQCPRFYLSQSDSFTACATGLPFGLEASRVSLDPISGRSMVAGLVLDEALGVVANLSQAVTHLLPGGEFALVARGGGGADKVRVSDGRIFRRLFFGHFSDLTRIIALPGTQDLLTIDIFGSIRRVPAAAFYP